MLLWSKDDLKQKYFLIRLTLILTVFFFDKDVTGAALSNEDLTKAFKQLEVKFEADQTKYVSTISSLENELKSFKNKSSKWIEEEQKSNNEAVVDRLDKMVHLLTKVKLHKFLYVCLNCRLKNNYDDNITRKINHSKRFKNTLNFEP